MEIRSREEIRREVSQQRHRPPQPQRIFFPADGLGESDPIDPARPIELFVEATYSNGTTVAWLTDEWWIHVQSVCRAMKTSIVIMPTPGALLDSIVLHQLEMLRRINPEWRLVGYINCNDIPGDTRIERLVYSPYDEIRIVETENLENNTDNLSRPARFWIEQAAELPTLTNYRRATLRSTTGVPIPPTQPVGV